MTWDDVAWWHVHEFAGENRKASTLPMIFDE